MVGAPHCPYTCIRHCLRSPAKSTRRSNNEGLRLRQQQEIDDRALHCLISRECRSRVTTGVVVKRMHFQMTHTRLQCLLHRSGVRREKHITPITKLRCAERGLRQTQEISKHVTLDNHHGFMLISQLTSTTHMHSDLQRFRSHFHSLRKNHFRQLGTRIDH